MSPALITADLQTRLIAGCATANKIDSRALPEGIETGSLTPLKRRRTTSPYIGIVFAAHNDEDFGAMSLVAVRRPPRSNVNVDPLFSP
jgi:hypothetical protein